MVRDIRFKAKALGTGEWVEGFLQRDMDYNLCILRANKEEHSWYWTQIDPSTVCQYTGMKDWEGREVWEHDVVLDAGEEEEVIFLDGCFQIHNLKHKNHNEDVPLCRCGEKGMIINTVLRSKFDKEDSL